MSVSSLPGPPSTPLLRLYVAGDTPGARRALETRIRVIELLRGKIDIEIVDVVDRPEVAEMAGILATPTLSDESIDPPRRLVGDISNIAQVLEYFGYRKRDSAP